VLDILADKGHSLLCYHVDRSSGAHAAKCVQVSPQVKRRNFLLLFWVRELFDPVSKFFLALEPE